MALIPRLLQYGFLVLIICSITATDTAIDVLNSNKTEETDRLRNQVHSVPPASYWAGMCTKGTLQSPIDLVGSRVQQRRFDYLQIRNYEKEQRGISVVNTGRSILLSRFSKNLEVRGGPLQNNTYTLEYISFRWESEHTIDSGRFPLETQFVHRNKRYNNITAAINKEDGVVVISVLHSIRENENQAIEKVLYKLNEIKSFNNINKPVTLTEPLKVSELLEDAQSYYTYRGSLTTPPCTESVRWIVLQRRSFVSEDQLHQFREIECGQSRKLMSNYRPTQKYNNREVYSAVPATMHVPHRSYRSNLHWFKDGSATLDKAISIIILILVPLVRYFL